MTTCDFDPDQFWRSHKTTLDDGREFIDCEILHKISGSAIPNKIRNVSAVVEQMLEGTPLYSVDVIRRVPATSQHGRSVVKIAVSYEKQMKIFTFTPPMGVIWPWPALVRFFK